MVKLVDEQVTIEERFVERLENLVEEGRLGDLARLRRNAGHSMGEARGALALFYRLLPERLEWREEIYFLVATLFPWNVRDGGKGNFGTSMLQLRRQTGNESIDRRMEILLDADFDASGGGRPRPGELGFRLRQSVKLLAAQDIPISWRQLAKDLNRWSHPDRWVQRKWAREYFGIPSPSDDEAE